MSTAERPSSTTPSVATFSPGRTTKRSPTASCLDRRSRAPSSERDVLGAELEQRRQRGAGAALGAGLEVAAGEDERRHDRGGLEVDLGSSPRPARGSGRTPSACRPCRRRRRRARTATTARPASMPSEISVSIVAVPWRRLAHAARWNGHAPQSTTGVARFSASHCQLSNCSAGIIETSSTGSDSSAETIRRKRSGASLVALLVARRARSLGSTALVAGGLDRADERLGRDGLRVVVDASPSRWRS